MPPSGLVCAFNEPFLGKHPKCHAYTERLLREFGIAVLTGELDRRGYDVNEAKRRDKGTP